MNTGSKTFYGEPVKNGEYNGSEDFNGKISLKTDDKAIP
jgi:hypothetical protein